MSQIGMNLRVTECCDQGGRKYMEDRYAVHFERNEKGVVEFGYFGVFDGHGGAEAAKFSRDRLLEEITKYDEFWTDNDENVCQAIKAGFLDTHKAMWKERDKWPMTSSGFASTAGTTASIAIIKNCKLYVGHVGDSGIVLGQQGSPTETFEAVRLTKDHKPESPEEQQRIVKSGGCVMRKAGVNRVVWNRPRNSHKGPVRRSTQIDQIPFLAVARSLGDLWSYNYKTEEFVVSPEPDVSVRHLFPRKDRCLILGSDGLWNMLSAEDSCRTVQEVEKEVEKLIVSNPNVQLNHWVNVSEKLVKLALYKWRSKMMRADNTSAMVVMIDPLGPSRWLQLRKKREDHLNKLNIKNNNCLENSSVSLTPESDRSDSPDFITETDRNAATPIINGDFILPLTPKSATPRGGNSLSFDMPMDEDYDEVDGDLSIVSNSRLPSIGSEIVIDSSTPASSGKLITDDIQCSNGELDELEAEVMEENLLKNFKSPMNKNPTVPLLKNETSFMTFSGAPPSSLRLESAKGSSPVSAFSGKGNCGKLQKLHVKKIGGSPQKFPSMNSTENYPVTDDIFPSSDSPCKINPFLEEPDSPVRINPFTGRPGVKIVREYLYNETEKPDHFRPHAAKLLPGKPGDKVEVVREYLNKKNSDDSVVINLTSRTPKEKPGKLPIFSKSKKFNVTIIREYLMKKKKKKHLKTHSKAKPSPLLPAETPRSCQTNFVGEVSMPSCSNSNAGKCGWAKWLSGNPLTYKKLKSLKGKPATKPSVTIVSNDPSVVSNGHSSSTSDSRQRSASFTNLTSGQPVVEAKKCLSLADITKTDIDRKRSNSVGNVAIGHVLKIKNGDENAISSVKTRNSPRGFGASCSLASVPSKHLHSEHAMTGKEQIDSSSPALVRRVLRRNTPARSENKNTHQRSKSAPSLSIKRRGINSLRSAFQKKTSAANITPVRVLRSVMGLKRKSAIISSPDVLVTKRMRHSSKGRHS